MPHREGYHEDEAEKVLGRLYEVDAAEPVERLRLTIVLAADAITEALLAVAVKLERL